MLFVIVGLGNPGKIYGATRHNIGFRVLNHLAEQCKIELNKIEHFSHVGSGDIADRRVLLVKPQTYMNRSGLAVEDVSRFNEVPLDRIVVVHDDIDLALGRIQVRRGGGHGGHRGLQSIIETIEANDFIRLRLGIDRPAESEDVSEYVLEAFNSAELEIVANVVQRATAALITWLEDGLNTAMNRFNPWKLSEDKN